jgi:hypothetical protein
MLVCNIFIDFIGSVLRASVAHLVKVVVLDVMDFSKGIEFFSLPHILNSEDCLVDMSAAYQQG